MWLSTLYESNPSEHPILGEPEARNIDMSKVHVDFVTATNTTDILIIDNR